MNHNVASLNFNMNSLNLKTKNKDTFKLSMPKSLKPTIPARNDNSNSFYNKSFINLPNKGSFSINDKTNINTNSNSNSYRNGNEGWINTNISLCSPNDSAIEKDIYLSIVGLDNLGNTCYLNTCLQNLIHCKPFIQRLIQSSKLIKSISKENITQAFYNLCGSIIYCRTRSLPPKDFKTIFGRCHIEFNGFSQHDTQECCRMLLNDISNEMNIVKDKPKYYEIETKNKTKKEIFDDYTQYFLERENSIIVDTFYGQTENIFVCTCGFESYSYQKFLDLPILLPERMNLVGSISLMQLLSDFFNDNEIKWEAKCEQCSLKTVHIKKYKLVILPEILIISFQRYNCRTKRKNSISIQYPFQIDLSMFIDKDCYTRGETSYTLTGISNHSGSMAFGHYYAFQLIEGFWYEFNDSFVNQCRVSNESTGAYCLFYQKNNTSMN